MPYKTRWNRPEECDHERRPLDVDELFDQLERELGFAEEGTNWYNFLDSLRNDVLAWLDTPEEERNAPEEERRNALGSARGKESPPSLLRGRAERPDESRHQGRE